MGTHLHKRLTPNRRLMLQGYECLLREAKPNGRYSHELANKLMGIRGSLQCGIDIAEHYEQEVKALIRKLYA